MKPITALIILDGFGYREEKQYNAILTDGAVNFMRLWKTYPHTLIGASGMDVGLPDGQMGNSEVGHTNIGAGRIVYQELTRITKTSWVEAWNSACLSRCPRGERPLVELYLEPGVFSERCTEKLPLRVDCIHRREFGEVSGHRVLIKRGPGNRGPTECGTTHEATSGMSS